MTEQSQAALLQALEKLTDGREAMVTVVPGRITIVGDHVDYAGGATLCGAIDMELAVGISVAGAGMWRLLLPSGAGGSGSRVEEREELWLDGGYADTAFATLLGMEQAGFSFPPLEMAVVSQIPPGAGLSSSAALCCGISLAVARFTGVGMTAPQLVAQAQMVENDILGVPCGTLDQTAIVYGRKDELLLFDAGKEQTASVACDMSGYRWLLCPTRKKHSTGGKEYRERRAQLEAAAAELGITSWREVQEEDLRRLRNPLYRSRARHVVTETRRSLEAVEAARSADFGQLGALMLESHSSLSQDYEVSTAALDTTVGAAMGVQGVMGARLVGAGFGGCVLALCEMSAVQPCRIAMSSAAGVPPEWVVQVNLTEGLAMRYPESVRPG